MLRPLWGCPRSLLCTAVLESEHSTAQHSNDSPVLQGSPGWGPLACPICLAQSPKQPPVCPNRSVLGTRDCTSMPGSHVASVSTWAKPSPGGPCGHPPEVTLQRPVYDRTEREKEGLRDGDGQNKGWASWGSDTAGCPEHRQSLQPPPRGRSAAQTAVQTQMAPREQPPHPSWKRLRAVLWAFGAQGQAGATGSDVWPTAPCPPPGPAPTHFPTAGPLPADWMLQTGIATPGGCSWPGTGPHPEPPPWAVCRRREWAWGADG